jgi:acyl dehydratase
MPAGINPVTTQQIVALNDAEASENRIHSDDIALKYGFSGALVSGANVFGYLCQPLVRAYGARWLGNGVLDVLFLKPAYQDDLLAIETENVGADVRERKHRTSAVNAESLLIARLDSRLPAKLPPINALAHAVGEPAQTERTEITWDLIDIDRPAPAYSWNPSEQDNMERVNAQRDQAALYFGGSGLIHPYYLLDACNKALKRMFILPAWIHTGSRIILRKALHAGQAIKIHAVPIEKWERKGHQFIKLYIAMWSDDEVAVEVEHSAIFRIAT